MIRLRRCAAVGFVGVVVLSGCSGPVPVHETLGWGGLIDGVQTDLAAIEPDPIQPTIFPDLYEGYTQDSPNAVETDIRELGVGQCLLYPNDENHEMMDIVRVVPCEEAHYGEVYGMGAFTRPVYPEDLVSIVTASCEEQFEPYVGIEYWYSALYYDAVYPTENGWEQGFRGWICYAYDADYETVGSVEGSGR